MTKDVNEMTNGELEEEAVRQLQINFPDKSIEELRFAVLAGGESVRHGNIEMYVTDMSPERRLKAMLDNARRILREE